MLKIGCHVSIAGGVENAPDRAHKLKCETFQIFSRSPQSYKAPKIEEDGVKKFWSAMKKIGFDRFYIHAPYLVNLASKDNRVRYGSINILREELERGTKLKADYVIAHIGSGKGRKRKEAVEKVIESTDKILEGYKGSCRLLLEISAGAGDIIGGDFKEMGTIIKAVKNPHLGGVCFDTCHAFAFGYELDDKTFGEFDKHVGISKIKVVHANDSKFKLGENRDRHEHIGEGYIGSTKLRELMHRSHLRAVDWILETKHDKVEADIEFLKKSRG